MDRIRLINAGMWLNFPSVLYLKPMTTWMCHAGKSPNKIHEEDEILTLVDMIWYQNSFSDQWQRRLWQSNKKENYARKGIEGEEWECSCWRSGLPVASSGYRHFWDLSPGQKPTDFFKEVRKLYFTADKNSNAAAIYSTPVKKNPMASKEPHSLCFSHLQLLAISHFLVGISWNKSSEEMPWNGGHETFREKMRNGTRQKGGGITVGLFSWAEQRASPCTLGLQHQLTCSSAVSEIGKILSNIWSYWKWQTHVLKSHLWWTKGYVVLEDTS